VSEQTAEPAAPAAGEGPLGERVDRLEAGQERQDSKLDQILGMLSGAKDKPAETVTEAEAAPGDMAEQMRQAVRDVRAEEAAAAKPEPKTPEPETTPREVMIRGKARLQKTLFGGER
jgi:hypothetical protein